MKNLAPFPKWTIFNPVTKSNKVPGEIYSLFLQAEIVAEFDYKLARVKAPVISRKLFDIMIVNDEEFTTHAQGPTQAGIASN